MSPIWSLGFRVSGVDASMPENLVQLICGELQLKLEEEVYRIPGMLALADLQSLPVRPPAHASRQP
eukprot:scaffold5221_cov18-Prasinocladus_malaysianus.AAC.1